MANRTGWQVWVEWVWRSIVGRTLGLVLGLIWLLMYSYLFVVLNTSLASQYYNFSKLIRIEIVLLNSFASLVSLGITAFIASYVMARMQLTTLIKFTESDRWDNRWPIYTGILLGTSVIIGRLTGYDPESDLLRASFIIQMLWEGLILGYVQSKILANHFKRVNVWTGAVILTAISLHFVVTLLEPLIFLVNFWAYIFILQVMFSIGPMITGLVLVRLVKRPVLVER